MKSGSDLFDARILTFDETDPPILPVYRPSLGVVLAAKGAHAVHHVLSDRDQPESHHEPQCHQGLHATRRYREISYRTAIRNTGLPTGSIVTCGLEE